MFKFNCSLGNRYFWSCMLEHTKRQVHKWRIFQHSLSRYVYNRSLFAIFTHVSTSVAPSRGKVSLRQTRFLQFWYLFHMLKRTVLCVLWCNEHRWWWRRPWWWLCGRMFKEQQMIPTLFRPKGPFINWKRRGGGGGGRLGEKFQKTPFLIKTPLNEGKKN